MPNPNFYSELIGHCDKILKQIKSAIDAPANRRQLLIALEETGIMRKKVIRHVEEIEKRKETIKKNKESKNDTKKS